MSLVLPRENLTAGLLAAVVHGVFLLLLVFSVSWQIHDPEPIMAELWQALPEPLPLPPAPPQVVPQPTSPPPKAEPVPEAKPADIALEKKKQEDLHKKQKLEEARAEKLQQLELKKKQEQEKNQRVLLKQRQREDDKQAELEMEQEFARIEAEQQKREQTKKLAEQKRREILRQEEETLQRQMLEESLASDLNAAKVKGAAAQRAGDIDKIVARYKIMIGDKVRGNTRLPENLDGNPEAEFDVSVLPTGEIAKIKLVKSSGNPAYDKEVQRGIEKSSPLPVPPDREAAAQFKLLRLKHKARE